MDTKAFMFETGIGSKQLISYYVKIGILEPTKLGKQYDFTFEDVSRLNDYKSGVLKPTKYLEDNLKHIPYSALESEMLRRKNLSEQPKPDQEPEYVWED